MTFAITFFAFIGLALSLIGKLELGGGFKFAFGLFSFVSWGLCAFVVFLWMVRYVFAG